MLPPRLPGQGARLSLATRAGQIVARDHGAAARKVRSGPAAVDGSAKGAFPSLQGVKALSHPPPDTLWVRVYYEDTDFSARVYHASYLRFLERGRTEWLRKRGFAHRDLAQSSGVAFAVRSLQIEYLAPAMMDDLLERGDQRRRGARRVDHVSAAHLARRQGARHRDGAGRNDPRRPSGADSRRSAPPPSRALLTPVSPGQTGAAPACQSEAAAPGRY